MDGSTGARNADRPVRTGQWQAVLERHVSVTTSKDEHDPAHAGTLGQLLLTFYAYGDRFVKFVVTPEARPEKEPVNAFAI